ncbi:hypothetical protein PAHAL_1G086100 [Panicum hallii]|uniref:Uncharacterized protein n=1 Tax=Panicum hallii TaxID=206008 RepID=A0A2T8KUH3_9POAL|nr:hypothetical protein PAHAL_1G086100 [Panicum hallii]
MGCGEASPCISVIAEKIPRGEGFLPERESKHLAVLARVVEALVEDEAAEGPGEKGANGGEVEGRAPDAVMTFDVEEVC